MFACVSSCQTALPLPMGLISWTPPARDITQYYTRSDIGIHYVTQTSSNIKHAYLNEWEMWLWQLTISCRIMTFFNQIRQVTIVPYNGKQFSLSSGVVLSTSWLTWQWVALQSCRPRNKGRYHREQLVPSVAASLYGSQRQRWMLTAQCHW